jgi:hypothetical protein
MWATSGTDRPGEKMATSTGTERLGIGDVVLGWLKALRRNQPKSRLVASGQR